MIDFTSPQYEMFLAENNLLSFDDLWSRDEKWFEPRNIGKSESSWSGVVRIDTAGKSFFLKRQENYFTLSPRYPFKISVVEDEYRNIATFTECEVPSLEVVACKVRLKGGKRQALIMTAALDGYVDLDSVSRDLPRSGLSVKAKRHMLKSLAQLIKLSHSNGLFHGNLYPNHLFIDQKMMSGPLTSDSILCRFIDMERAGKAFPRKRKQLRDIETLDRRTPNWSKSDRLYFLLNYLNVDSCDQSVRDYLCRLSKISKKKTK
jgi:hypothetical protein